MRDHADNVVVICSIENFDPMGVHTGDSITVAPAQTLTDVEYQRMRDAAFACIRRIGVDTGGSNVQFAVNPADGEMVVIEMNPRVSRSQRAREQGDRVPDREDRGEARGRLPARRGPQRHHRRDAGVVRADDRLRRHQDPALGVREAAGRVAGARHEMQSVGEVMAIGRTFPESLQKALRSLETGRCGPQLRSGRARVRRARRRRARAAAAVPTPERIFQVEAALRRGVSVERLHEVTGIDPWFLDQMLADRRGARPARRESARDD